MSTMEESSRSAGRAKLDSDVDASKPAGRHEDVKGATDGLPEKPSEQTPVDGEKLDEILGLLWSQFESQQRQLDLLQKLTNSEATGEKPDPMQIPSLTDCERTVKWMDDGIPDSTQLKELGENFIAECAYRGQLWFPVFAAERARLHLLGRGASDAIVMRRSLEQRLLAAWPENLGKLEPDTRFVWDSQIGIHDWHIYNGEGKVPALVKRSRLT